MVAAATQFKSISQAGFQLPAFDTLAPAPANFSHAQPSDETFSTRSGTPGVNPTHFFLLHQSTRLTLYFKCCEETKYSILHGKEIHLA